MLKDITLGQFFPGSSIVHRLDPRTKLIALIVYIIALFSAGSWVSKKSALPNLMVRLRPIWYSLRESNPQRPLRSYTLIQKSYKKR